LTSDRRDVVIVDRTAIAAPKVAVAVTAARAMDAGPKDVVDQKVAADVSRMMALVIVVLEIVAQKVGVAVRKDVAAKDAAPRVADRVGPMARRDRRTRSGSSIASMKTKMAR
jgi:hypothetical protein